MQKEYWGPDEIVSKENLEHKSPTGDNVLKLNFARGEYEVVTERAYTLFRSSEPLDITLFQENRLKVILKETKTILLEYGINEGFVPTFLEQLGRNIADAFDRATHVLWTGNHKTYSVGYPTYGRSFIEADFKLVSNGKDIKDDNEPK